MGSEGPGIDVHQMVSRPLDRDQMANIHETALPLSAEERITLMASLVQFLMEVAHQVASQLTLGPERGELPDEADADEAGFMQTSTTVPDPGFKPGNVYERLQSHLETMTRHKAQRARLLHQRLATSGACTDCSSHSYVAGLQG